MAKPISPSKPGIDIRFAPPLVSVMLFVLADLVPWEQLVLVFIYLVRFLCQFI